MKKGLCAAVAAVILMTGCAGAIPARRTGETASGSTEPPRAEETADRLSLGKYLDAPLTSGEYTFYEKNEALEANGLYYATWTAGEASSYTNEDGNETELFPSQIYLIVYEGVDADDAAQQLHGWAAAAEARYKILDRSEITKSSVDYTLIRYETTNESTPYEGGTAAFGASGSVAVCAEAVYVAGYGGDAGLESFLDSLFILDTGS